MALKVAVTEDDSLFRKELVEQISSVPGLEVHYSTDSGEDLLRVLDKISPEIVVLDISLPGISGIDVAKTVRQKLPHTEIIFVTAHEDYIKEAVKLYATDYISKPLDTARLKQTLNRIKQNLSSPEKLLELKTGKGIQVTRPQDICVVEAIKKKTIIHTATKTFTSDHSIMEIEAQLDQGMFYRTSRSYLVNLSKIKAIKPVSRTSFEILFVDKDCKAYLSKSVYTGFRSKLKKLSAGGGQP
ncbi:hypothetical protein SY88_21250 [Clostridiales bacterium PH28_bin88]|nr:hypothetical protein SY88_21250 [Clostridiales bacterium PH28_bin88]